MTFLTAVLTRIGIHLADKVFDLVKSRLDEYFEVKTKIGKIGTEAKGLTDELEGAQSDNERIAILRKISDFADSVDKYSV